MMPVAWRTPSSAICATVSAMYGCQLRMDGTHTVRGVNRIGLRRSGFDADRIRALHTAFRILFRTRLNLREAIGRVEEEVRSPDVDELLAFIRASRRGVAMGPRSGAAADEEDEA